LAEFYRLLPKSPMANLGFKNAGEPGWMPMSQVPKRELWRYSQVQFPANVRHYFAMDNDSPEARAVLSRLVAAGLMPEPSILIENPENGHAHALWKLAEPVRWAPGRQTQTKPLRYLNDLRRRLAEALHRHGFDPAFQGRDCKNPLARCWKVTTSPATYSLADLRAAVERCEAMAWQEAQASTVDTAKTVQEAARTHTSEPALFEAARKVALELRRSGEAKTQADLAGLLRPIMDDLDAELGTQQSAERMDKMARNAAAYTWENYTARPAALYTSTGTMRAEYGPGWRFKPLPERRSLAGKRTNGMQREATEARIRDAVEGLKAKGQRVTVSAVADLIGMNKGTLARNYRQLFEALAGPLKRGRTG
jgi:hypothetical protein